MALNGIRELTFFFNTLINLFVFDDLFFFVSFPLWRNTRRKTRGRRRDWLMSFFLFRCEISFTFSENVCFIGYVFDSALRTCMQDQSNNTQRCSGFSSFSSFSFILVLRLPRFLLLFLPRNGSPLMVCYPFLDSWWCNL